MKRYINHVLILFFILAAVTYVNAQDHETSGQETPDVQAQAYEYRIGPGDVIRISVWKNVDLTADVVVLPDGTFSFPLIGVVPAEDKTIRQLEKVIEEKLGRYVTNPVISVLIMNVNSQYIYIIGKVNQPNRYLISSRVNVLQALSMAGGLSPFAKRDKIRIFHQHAGRTTIFPFDYDKVSEGRMLDENITMERGDIIVVP
jgi:polysaccharide export outer membrane protein